MAQSGSGLANIILSKFYGPPHRQTNLQYSNKNGISNIWCPIKSIFIGQPCLLPVLLISFLINCPILLILNFLLQLALYLLSQFLGAESLKLIHFTKYFAPLASQHLMNTLDHMSVPFIIITSSHALQEMTLKVCSDEALFIFTYTDVEDADTLNEMRAQFINVKLSRFFPIIPTIPDQSGVRYIRGFMLFYRTTCP